MVHFPSVETTPEPTSDRWATADAEWSSAAVMKLHFSRILSDFTLKNQNS
jgi:hypothetical protein